MPCLQAATAEGARTDAGPRRKDSLGAGIAERAEGKPEQGGERPPAGGNVGGEVLCSACWPPVCALIFVFAAPVVGTLTQNEMVFKRLHLGTVSYGADTMDEIQGHLRNPCPQVSSRTLARTRSVCGSQPELLCLFMRKSADFFECPKTFGSNL